MIGIGIDNEDPLNLGVGSWEERKLQVRSWKGKRR
jgi:hypothetical protein